VGVSTAMEHTITLSPAARRAIVVEAAAHVREGYVSAALGAEISNELETHVERWTSGDDGEVQPWLRGLNEWLRSRSGDPHLRLRFHATARPVCAEAVEEIDEACPAFTLRAQNFGFRRVEILAGNIALLELQMFAPPESAEPTAAAAMTFLAHSAAVVIDLRGNTGGHSGMVGRLASYFLPGHQALCSLHDRALPTPAENWSIAGPHTRPEVPLLLLTGSRTASAAESFAYDMRRLGRALTVGERTLGAAHAIRAHRLHPHVRLVLPYAQVLDPTGNNWHGTGVVPDFPCAAHEALEVALERLRSRPK